MMFKSGSEIPEAVSAAQSVEEWSQAIPLAIGILGVIITATFFAIRYYRMPFHTREFSPAWIPYSALPFFLAPSITLVFYSSFVDPAREEVQSSVLSEVEDNVNLDAVTAYTYEPDSSDPYHIRDADIAMTVSLQSKDSIYTAEITMLYDEDYDTMIPADSSVLDSLPIVEGSSLAAFIENDGYDFMDGALNSSPP